MTFVLTFVCLYKLTIYICTAFKILLPSIYLVYN